MNDNPRAITFLGTTDFRNQHTRFGIYARDRLRHMYIIGATGVGKSTFIENMIIQDIQAGNGVAIFDPHGSTAEKLLSYIPESRINDVVYFAPFDLENPVGFNPLEDPGLDLRYQVADGLLSAFKKIWSESFSARMEYILSMTLLALLEYPGSTLLSVNRMYSDKAFRNRVIAVLQDPSVKSFWIDEFGKWDEKYAREATAAIQNKIGQFTSNPLIRNILGQEKTTFKFREIMDQKKIFIANLSKGRVGEQNAPLIGAMLITKLYLAAMSRADMSERNMERLPPFYVYVDEFQNFANDSFENILSESRKYKLGLIVAHQYVDQMNEKIESAVFGNVGTKVVFRLQKPEDAEIFEKAFAPVFMQADFLNLGLAQIYISLMVDGVGSAPFSARSLPPIQMSVVPYVEQVVAASKRQYTVPRAQIETSIAEMFAVPTANASLPKQMKFDTATKSSAENSSESEKQKFIDSQNTYYAQKKAEIEARGGVWMTPEEYRKQKELGTLPTLNPKSRFKTEPVQNQNITNETSTPTHSSEIYTNKNTADHPVEQATTVVSPWASIAEIKSLFENITAQKKATKVIFEKTDTPEILVPEIEPIVTTDSISEKKSRPTPVVQYTETDILGKKDLSANEQSRIDLRKALQSALEQVETTVQKVATTENIQSVNDLTNTENLAVYKSSYVADSTGSPEPDIDTAKTTKHSAESADSVSEVWNAPAVSSVANAWKQIDPNDLARIFT